MSAVALCALSCVVWFARFSLHWLILSPFMRVSIDGCTEIEDLRGGQGTAAKMVLVKRPVPLKGLPASATPSAKVRTYLPQLTPELLTC